MVNLPVVLTCRPRVFSARAAVSVITVTTMQCRQHDLVYNDHGQQRGHCQKTRQASTGHNILSPPATIPLITRMKFCWRNVGAAHSFCALDCFSYRASPGFAACELAKMMNSDDVRWSRAATFEFLVSEKSYMVSAARNMERWKLWETLRVLLALTTTLGPYRMSVPSVCKTLFNIGVRTP